MASPDLFYKTKSRKSTLGKSSASISINFDDEHHQSDSAGSSTISSRGKLCYFLSEREDPSEF